MDGKQTSLGSRSDAPKTVKMLFSKCCQPPPLKKEL